MNAYRRTGCTLQDTLGVVLMAGLLVAFAAAHAGNSRRMARAGEDMSHLRTIASHTASYAADFQDLIWQFSWGGNQVHWSPNDPLAAGFTTPLTDTTAARQQLTYLIRSRGSRTAAETPNLAGVNLYPYSRHANIVLIDYLGDSAPSRLFVSAADPRARWADDPRGYDQGLFTPNLGIGGYNYRHPFASSFQIGTCFHDSAPLGMRVAPVSTVLLALPNAPGALAGRPLSGVAYPSQKALLHDTIARHFGPRQTYHMFPEARLPVLMTEGSVAVRSFAEANRGADPNQPSGAPPTLLYAPGPIDPPATGPNTGSVNPGPLWTRMGLHGRDFGGPEVYPQP